MPKCPKCGKYVRRFTNKCSKCKYEFTLKEIVPDEEVANYKEKQINDMMMSGFYMLLAIIFFYGIGASIPFTEYIYILELCSNFFKIISLFIIVVLFIAFAVNFKYLIYSFEDWRTVYSKSYEFQAYKESIKLKREEERLQRELKKNIMVTNMSNERDARIKICPICGRHVYGYVKQIMNKNTSETTKKFAKLGVVVSAALEIIPGGRIASKLLQGGAEVIVDKLSETTIISYKCKCGHSWHDL